MIETRNNQTDRSTQFGLESNEEEIIENNNHDYAFHAIEI